MKFTNYVKKLIILLSIKNIFEAITPLQILNYCFLAKEFDDEYIIVIYLCNNDKIIKHKTLYRKILLESDAEDIFKQAARLNASRLVVIHNQKSNEPNPTQSDRKNTLLLLSMGENIGIPMEDYIVNSPNGFSSYRQHRFL